LSVHVGSISRQARTRRCGQARFLRPDGRGPCPGIPLLEKSILPSFKLPLSADVSQAIKPWTVSTLRSGWSTSILANPPRRRSKPGSWMTLRATAVSQAVSAMRRSRCCALSPPEPLLWEERAAIDKLRRMLDDMADIKERHQGAPQCRRTLRVAPDASAEGNASGRIVPP
jgi:hypothetical protein